jgi:hypothetical protein
MRNALIVILIFLSSCSAQKNSIKETENVTENNIVDIAYQSEVDYISFTIKNENNFPISYVKTNTLNIEHRVGDNWKHIRILPCVCDAPCREINDEITIEPNKSIIIKWNMIESWCGKRESNEFVRKTISQKVEQGKYKFNLYIKDKDGNTKQVNKEFIIN